MSTRTGIPRLLDGDLRPRDWFYGAEGVSDTQARLREWASASRDGCNNDSQLSQEREFAGI